MNEDLNSAMSIYLRASLVPAAAVIPAQVAYTDVVAVKKLVVHCPVLCGQPGNHSGSSSGKPFGSRTGLYCALPCYVHGTGILRSYVTIQKIRLIPCYSAGIDVRRASAIVLTTNAPGSSAGTTCGYTFVCLRLVCCRF